MIRLRFAVGAIALAILTPAAAVAQLPPASFQMSDGSYHGANATPTYCSNGAAWVPCPVLTGGGGGGGTGDASAANQTSVQAVAGSDAAKAIAVQFLTGGKALAVTGTFWQGTQPVSGTVTANLGTIGAAATSAKQDALLAALGAPLQAGGTVNLGISGAGTAGTPLYTATGTPTNGTPGSAAPAYAQQVGGVGPSGNLRALSVSTLGGLLPGQGVPTSTRTTLTASIATAIETAGVAGRIAESFFVEAALTAPVYICSTQTTSCSATAYDFLIPSGATAGTIYSPIFATTARLYAYSTGTPVVVLNSWIAQ